MGQFTEVMHELKNGQKCLLRTAQEKDAEKYICLVKSVISEVIYSLTQESEFTFTVEQQASMIKSHADDPNHLILVCEIDGKVVGQLDFTNGHKKRIAHTGDFGIGVHKDHRGMGLGSLLLEGLIKWANANSTIEKINLSVHHTNDRAIAMYEKFGFIKEGIRTKDLKYSDSEYVDTVLMGLQL